MVSINSSLRNGKFRKFERDKKEESRGRDKKFNKKWTSKYFFIENADSRPLCLICNQTVNVNKEYNIIRHYDLKHADGVYGKLKGCDRELKVKHLKEQLKIQCLTLFRLGVLEILYDWGGVECARAVCLFISQQFLTIELSFKFV